MNKKCCKSENESCENKSQCCRKQTKGINDYMKLGFAFWLTIVFVALKIFGAIEWSWLWVLSPIWIGYSLVFVLIIAYIGLSTLAGHTTNIRLKLLNKKKKEKAED
jgi:fatty acid desaturase